MKISLEYLEEPRLRFGEHFEHEDTKTGIAEFGPFGKSIPGLHPNAIRLGFVGTRKGILLAKEWVDRCSGPIESENIKTIRSKSVESPLFDADFSPSEEVRHRFEKILNRDFIGFNTDSAFECEFQVNARWDRTLLPRDLAAILNLADSVERVHKLVGFFDEQISSLTSTSPAPDVIVIVVPQDVIEKAHSTHLGGNHHLNFRRALKARVMQHSTPVPIQLVRETVLEGKGRLQEVATRAWNFCTAQYYKSEGVPWAPISLDEDTCYIGISFFTSRLEGAITRVQSSLAQAFDFMGQGLVLRGE